MIQSYKIETSIGEVILRPYEVRDVKYQIAYLYDSSDQFLRDIGFEPSKFIGREKHQMGIEKRIREQTPEGFMSIVAEFEKQVFAVVHLHPGDSPKAHFHIFDSSMRGKALGLPILKNALKVLMSKYDLEEIRIEPKVDNIAMNRLMVKCGFEFIERTVYKSPVTAEFEAASYLVRLDLLD